jgi:hypothetical protein
MVDIYSWYRSATESYNGSAWTSGGTINTSRNSAGAAGIQTAALEFGGGTPTDNRLQNLIMDQLGQQQQV